MSNGSQPAQPAGTPINKATDIQYRPASSARHLGDPLPRKKRKGFITGIIILLLIATVTIGYLVYNQASSLSKIDKDSYQAVFLTNGQVYFGELHNTDGSYLELTNIFYLQANQSLQDASKSADPTQVAPGSSDGIKLIKLGDELHGPQDHMQISTKQVLFWENLKDNGKVAQAIDNYKPDPNK